MFWENIPEENCAVFECTSMISNALVIHSGGRPASSRLTESRVRSAQRRLNIAPMPLTFDDNSNSSPSKDENSHEEISLYSGNSPQGSPRPCLSPCLELGLLSPSRETESIEERHDIDYNSVDSGFSHSSRKLFAFGPGENVQSPPKTPSPTAAQKRISPKSISCFRTFNSISSDSMESMDDECIGLVDMDSLEENTSLPTSFNTIISGNIKTTSNRTPLFRRCLSLTDNNINRSKNISETKTHQVLKTIRDVSTPFAPKISIEPSRTFKRPEPPGTCSPVQIKRYKQGSITPVSSSEDKENKTSNDLPIARPILRKSISMNDAIMNALARSSSDPDLIGDFSKPFSLPLIDGRHKDLRSITVHTMAALLRGEFQDSIASFRVIDCRYPYEFEGGHIRGAENLFTHEQIINELVNTKTEDPKVIPEGPMRNIVVFHCEFSSERGPKLSRFLRNNDRLRNESSYPALHYPEIYLLHNGYKEFYETYPEFCDPINYRQMSDPKYSEAYRHFRAKSKSWNGDGKSLARSTSNRLIKTKSRNLIY